MQTIFKKLLHIWFYAGGIRSAADTENNFKISAAMLKNSVICCINQDSPLVVTSKALHVGNIVDMKSNILYFLLIQCYTFNSLNRLIF